MPKFSECLGNALTANESYIAKCFFDEGVNNGFQNGFMCCVLSLIVVGAIGGVGLILYSDGKRR